MYQDGYITKEFKAGLFILRTFKGIRDADTGKDPGFVDIKSTAVIFKDFKRQ